MPEYTVCVIGETQRGNYGHGIDTVWKDLPHTKVVAVADRHDMGRAAAAKRLNCEKTYTNYREMLQKEQPTLVAVAPRWIDQHAEMLVASLEAGAHIFTEKPFVRTPAEADQVMAAATMRHLKLAIAHQAHYSPTTRAALRVLRDGAIGKILEIRARGKEDARGGTEDLWVLGSHMLDLMLMIGGAPTTCFATIWKGDRPADRGDIFAGAEGLGPLLGDALHARYTFPNGVLGTFASVKGQGGSPARFAVQVYGSKGVVEIDNGYNTPAWLLRDPGWSPGRGKSSWEQIPVTPDDRAGLPAEPSLHAGNIAAVQDLLACIEDGSRQPLCGMEAGKAGVEMIHAVFASHVAGQAVSLPLASRGHGLGDWIPAGPG